MTQNREYQTETARPPDGLAAHWRAADIVANDARWTPLTGGRTNAVWRIDSPGGSDAPLVCKLFRPGGATPLFGNDPDAEVLALGTLAGTGLAPDFVAAADTPSGKSVIYRHVSGHVWSPDDDISDVARALARLHALPAPTSLPEAHQGGAAIRAQARDMLADLPETDRAAFAPAPRVPDLVPVAPVFIHGDATAGNALVKATGVTFIDWQCPARGDPTDDIATFLSPAMQVISGNTPLRPDQVDRFLSAYGDPDVAARFRALRPLYHWRMAAYCAWRAARGDVGYGAAALLERAAFRE